MFCGVVDSVNGDMWTVWSAVCAGVVVSVDVVDISAIVDVGDFPVVRGWVRWLMWPALCSGVVVVVDLGQGVISSSVTGHFLLTHCIGLVIQVGSILGLFFTKLSLDLILYKENSSLRNVHSTPTDEIIGGIFTLVHTTGATEPFKMAPVPTEEKISTNPSNSC